MSLPLWFWKWRHSFYSHCFEDCSSYRYHRQHHCSHFVVQENCNGPLGKSYGMEKMAFSNQNQIALLVAVDVVPVQVYLAAAD